MEQENETVEETTQTPEVEEVEEVETDDVETLKKELATAKAQKEHWRKKAGTVEETKPVEAPSKSDEPSFLDGVLLAKAEIHEEDIERVIKFAKSEGLSVKEALGNEDMQAILDRRSEARKVAEASNTSSVKAGQVEKTGEAILKAAKSGKLPDADDLESMWDAELKR